MDFPFVRLAADKAFLDHLLDLPACSGKLGDHVVAERYLLRAGPLLPFHWPNDIPGAVFRASQTFSTFGELYYGKATALNCKAGLVRTSRALRLWNAADWIREVEREYRSRTAPARRTV